MDVREIDTTHPKTDPPAPFGFLSRPELKKIRHRRETDLHHPVKGHLRLVLVAVTAVSRIEAASGFSPDGYVAFAQPIERRFPPITPPVF
jgi:hypothetical protein